MNKKEKVNFVIKSLESLYPEVPIPLNHHDPYTLLIAVLLSAQCTDKRVNKITPLLFKKILNGGGGWIRTIEDRSQRVYSPPHLTALEPLLWGSVPCSIKLQTTCVLYILFM